MTESLMKPEIGDASQENNQTPEVPEKKSALPWIIGIVALAVIAGIVFGAIILIRQDPADTSHIRDIFIIFLALEMLVIGLALVILIVQLATLTNLLQNEIKPIIETTNETANTIKGTAQFLSDNAVEPVMKLNEYVASIKKLIDLVFNPGK